MNNIKKIITLVITFAMVMMMSIPAFAASSDKGSITVSNATKGAIYQAYQVFEATPDAENDGIVYKIDASNTALLNAVKAEGSPFDVSDVATAGKYSVAKKASASDDSVIVWLKANVSLFGTPVSGAYQDADGTVLFDKLAYGYYYVTSTIGAAVSVTTNSPNATIKDKNPNEPSDLAKKVNDAEKDDAIIGETQSYSVSFNATNYVTKGNGDEGKAGTDPETTIVKQYTITDTYTNLRINDTSKIKVTVNGTEVSPKSVDVAPNTDEATGGKLTVVLDWVDENDHSKFAYAEGATSIPVVLTYEAEVTSKALNTAGNSVVVEQDATTDTLTDTTTTTTYNFDLKKVDENLAPLAGAEFELVGPDGKKVSLVKTAKGDPATAAAEDATEWDYRVADSKDAVTTTTIVSDADGVVAIKGIDKVIYTLTETKAPVGYNKGDDQKVTGGSTASVTVVNEQGAVLPTTGGIGTTIFYILGSALVIGCGIVLISRKRMQKK